MLSMQGALFSWLPAQGQLQYRVAGGFSMGFSEYLFIGLFFGLPGLLGGWLAHTRGKNPLLWGLLSAPFPFFVLIIWFQKPADAVPGHFKKCPACGGVYPWKLQACRYCGAGENEKRDTV